MAKTFNLFISHSWTYTDAYDKLCNLLDSASYFSYNNFSVPKDDPIHNAPSVAALYTAIKQQMTTCHAVLILAGVYSTYSKWITREIKIANSEFTNPKPIIGIKPRAATRVSTEVSNAADIMVSWSTSSIIQAIRDYAI